ncbi:hypothetical protein ABZ949_02145 [Micromonospora tulbaghiae]|uniref:hypothetical protein n=1 Tax=Micromonospora tulbaghiae TaxID=479978 RepID=UPI0033F4949F
MDMAVIANTGNGGYAHRKIQRLRAVVMGDEQRAERQRDEIADLERRVRAGEWLKTGSVAKLLGMGRTKVHTLLASGEIGYRLLPGAAVKPQRECDPADVLRLLDQRRRVHHGPTTSPGSPA